MFWERGCISSLEYKVNLMYLSSVKKKRSFPLLFCPSFFLLYGLFEAFFLKKKLPKLLSCGLMLLDSDRSVYFLFAYQVNQLCHKQLHERLCSCCCRTIRGRDHEHLIVFLIFLSVLCKHGHYYSRNDLLTSL